MKNKTIKKFSRHILPVVFLILTVKIFAQDHLPKIVLTDSGKIFTEAPFKSCHSSTIVSLNKDSLLYAWFGGDYEGAKNVCIWGVFRNAVTGKFDKIFKLAEAKDDEGNSLPCWNPVLFKSDSGTMFLYYKVGKNPREWLGEYIVLNDNGKLWSAPKRLPNPYLGPIKNKPVQLDNGDILAPSSVESIDEKHWTIHLELYDKDGEIKKYIPIDCDTFNVIQPTILAYGKDTLQMLCRSKENVIVQTWSYDNGGSWQPLTKINLPNPNSGIDAVTLKNGWQMLVYNPMVAGAEWQEGRSVLKAAISKDGVHWNNVLTLENHVKGEYSYPSIIQDKSGVIRIAYTDDRKYIKYVDAKVE